MLGSIWELVQNRLPFLGSTQQSLAESFKTEVMYDVQEFSGLSDVDVEDESKYSSIQKLLIADLTAWYMLNRQSMLVIGGENGASPQVQKMLKRAKADVTEAEFEQLKTTLAKSSLEISGDLKSQICNRAYKIGWRVPLCYDCWIVNNDVQAFIAVNPDC